MKYTLDSRVCYNFGVNTENMYSELWDDIEFQLVYAIVLHKQAKENKPQRRILIRKTGILMLASYFLKITTRDFHEISRYL